MRNKYLMHILVALVLVCSVLICGTANALGKYTGGTGGFSQLAFTTFSSYITAGIVVGDDDTPGDIVPGGDASDSIWGAGNNIEDPNIRPDYGWDDATELVFTVENKTDQEVVVNVIINMALPYQYSEIRVVHFNVPYTLREICPETGKTEMIQGYLSTYPEDSDDRPANSLSFTRVDNGIFWWLNPLYWEGLYAYYEHTVTIQTKLTLEVHHTHTYQFDLDLPQGEEHIFGIREEAAYYSIRVQVV